MSEGSDESNQSLEFPQIHVELPNVAELREDRKGGKSKVKQFNNIPTDGRPYTTIVEEPQARGFRFRYGCEGKSHGGLQGEKSSKSQKTYPAVQVFNYSGSVRVQVNLVTSPDVEDNIKDHVQPHVHQLIGKNCRDGVCIVEANGTNPRITFPQLGIMHVKKKGAQDALAEHIKGQMRQSKQLNNNRLNSNSGLSAKEEADAQRKAKTSIKDMKLDVVRLQFVVSITGKSGELRHLDTLISVPIYNSKSPGAGALKICRMDKHSGTCEGGQEVFLLCEKVQKDDIEVHFIREENNGETWDVKADFGPNDVHKQYAIVFRTPEYQDKDIEDPVEVQVQLLRPSDQEISEPKPFTYTPREHDRDQVGRKRKKKKVPTATLR